MKDRIEMYEKAIKELEEVHLKAIENEVKRMKIVAVGLSIAALIIGVVLVA